MSMPPVLSAYIAFAGPRHVDVHLQRTGQADMPMDIHELTLQFYAKSMYDLGPSEGAVKLRDYVAWTADRIWPPHVGNMDMSLPDITGGHFSLGDVGPDVTSAVGAFLRVRRDGVKITTTEYQTPKGEEEYYAFTAVVALIQHLTNTAGAWGDLLLPAAGLRAMSSLYAAGPQTWSTLEALVAAPAHGLQAALQGLAEEMARQSLLS